MDGTLTMPCIDFQEMRRQVGIMEGDILEAIDNMSPEDRSEAVEKLETFELKALDDMKIMPGVHELTDLLDKSKVPRALVTRNILGSVDYFHTHVFQKAPFEPALARCFRPYKPHPDSIVSICKHWGIPPGNSVMIGDSAKDDIVCGNRAGALTILIDFHGTVDLASLDGEQRPTFCVQSMHEVAVLLQEQCILSAPAL